MKNDRLSGGASNAAGTGVSAERDGSGPGLYVHVPFCATKCPYCDFASVTSGTPVGRWIEALERETALRRGSFGAFDTLYVGGGTPSVLSAPEMARLFGVVHAGFEIARGSETTLEANPDDVTAGASALWRELGANRVSLGVQSFDDGALRFLGRRHDAARAREALRLLRGAGFTNLGIDLIYGFDGQSLDLWRRTLAEALEWRPEHLSCYQLTIAPSTEFGRMLAAGTLAAVDEETQRTFFLETAAILAKAGYVHYEVSNFARDERFFSRHNRKYWSRLPYLGLGPSAHSFLDRSRWWNVRSVEEYVRRLAGGARPIEGSEALDDEAIALERLCLGFRTREGVPIEDLRNRRGWEAALETLVDGGLVTVAGGRAAPTTEGLCVADRLAAAFAE